MNHRLSFVSAVTAAALVILAIVGSIPLVHGQEDDSGSGAGIKGMMTPEQFRAAGLNKLSEEELQNLDNFLNRDRQQVEQKAEQKAEAKAAKTSKTKMDLIVSRIDGEFNGLTGKTVIKLEDGTTWKQANADDRFHANVTDHPGCAVIHTWLGYKMRVAGTPEFYVNPVRSR